MDRVEFSVVTRAAPQTVWQLYSDVQLWRSISPWYGEIRWLQGEPWKEGSRLSAVLAPRGVLMEYAIIGCVPGEKVGMIIRGEHVAAERWVFFERHDEGGTTIRTWAEFIGAPIQPIEKPFVEHLREFTEDWYSTFARHCDQFVIQQRGKSPGASVISWPESA